MTVPVPSEAIPLSQPPPVRESVHIRRVKEQDLLGVAHLLCESFYPQSSYWHWAVPLLRVGIYQDLRSRFITQPAKHICFVAVLTTSTPGELTQETLVGTVEVALKSLWLLQRNVPYISNLAVAPHYRRRGIAQQLLLACEPVARVWHANTLYLNVLRTNAAAQHLYRKIEYLPEDSTFCPFSTISIWPLGQSKRLLMRKQLETDVKVGSSSS
jgi:ribosomal protein S18 acetylase RimI-like enzyme